MHAGALHVTQRVFDLVVSGHGFEASDAPLGDRLLAVLTGGVQDVFEMHVSDDGTVVAGDREARVARLGDLFFHVCRCGTLGQDDELVEGDHRGPGRLLGEFQGAAEQTQLVSQHALLLRRDDDRCDLLDRVGGRYFRARLVTGQAHEPVREAIHGLDNRAQDVAQSHEDGRKDQQHAHGGGDRDVLGDHLAEDDVAEENDDEGGGKADDVAGRLGCAQALERRLDEVGNRGLGNDAQGRGRDRHAELADRQHEGHVLQRVQRSGRAARTLVGERLDLRATRRGDRELAGDEESVDGQQGHGDGETDSHAHNDTSSSSASGAGVIAT